MDPFQWILSFLGLREVDLTVRDAFPRKSAPEIEILLEDLQRMGILRLVDGR